MNRLLIALWFCILIEGALVPSIGLSQINKHAGMTQQSSNEVPPRLSSTIRGYFLDEKGKLIPPTTSLILQTQAGYIHRLKKEAGDSGKEEIKTINDAISSQGALPEGDQVWSNAVLIGALINKVKPGDTNILRLNNFTMLVKYANLKNNPTSMEDLIAGKIPAWVKTKPTISQDILANIFSSFSVSNALYEAKCAAAGVPIPPPWGSPLWINEKNSDNTAPLKTTFLVPPSILAPGGVPTGGKTDDEIYSFSTNDGLCLANPIINDTTIIPTVNYPKPSSPANAAFNALGIICQSLSTPTKPSHACFWDAVADNMPQKPNPHVPVSSNLFMAPPNLPDDNQCTDCHAGENAFVVHPGEAMDVAKSKFNTAHPLKNFTSQNNWYKPLVQYNWPRNLEPKPSPNGNGLCSGCHKTGFAGRLPNYHNGPNGVSANVGLLPQDELFKYCSFLLPNALALIDTDPGFSHSTMTNFAGLIQGDPTVTEVYKTCRAVFPPGVDYFPTLSIPPAPVAPNDWRLHQDPP